MKKLFFLALILSGLTSHAQDKKTKDQAEIDAFMDDKDAQEALDEKHSRQFKAKCGHVFYVGDKIKIGTGSLPSGNFKYININSASLFRAVSSNPELDNHYNSLGKEWSGYSEKIIRFSITGSKRVGYKTVAIISANGAIRYMVDVDPAIESGEIIVSDCAPKQSAGGTIIQQLSPADELLKYKKLMDEGIITKEEFEVQKQKLLSK